MRIAPIGLFFDEKSSEYSAYLAAEVCALTHGHELGYIPCCFVAYLINLLSHNKKIEIKETVEASLLVTHKKFKKYNSINYFVDLKKAIDLSNTETDDLKAIEFLGEGSGLPNKQRQ